jgi:hypothetical protein
VQNWNDVEIDNFCSRLQLPEPIIEIEGKPEASVGVQVVWRPLLDTNVLMIGGSGGRNESGAWSSGGSRLFPQYVQSCFFPQGHRAVRASFMAGITTGIWELQIDKIPPGGYVLVRFLTSNSKTFTKYLEFANAPIWPFPTNAAPAKPDIADTNAVRFSLEGQYQFQSEIKPGTQHFFMPLQFDQATRGLSSLPVQADFGHWLPVLLRFE